MVVRTPNLLLYCWKGTYLLDSSENVIELFKSVVGGNFTVSGSISGNEVSLILNLPIGVLL